VLQSPAHTSASPRTRRQRGGLQRLSVTQWFGLVVGVLLLVAALGLLAGLLALGRLDDRRELLADGLDPANVGALRLSNALLDEETGVRGYALSREGSFLEPYRRGRAEEEAALRELAGLLARDDLADVRADLEQVRGLAARWRAEYAEPVIAAVRAGDEPPPAAVGKQRFDAVRAALAREQAGLLDARGEARDELGRTADFVTAMFVGAGLLVLLSLLAAAQSLRRVVLRPVARLAGSVRAVARGDFQSPLPASGPREVAQLGRDVEAMRERIVAELESLRDAERRLIAQARELQRSNQELEQFAYVASHDLQEPLRKIAGFMQMLERRYKGELDDRADLYIAYAVDGAKRMQQLIGDLLEFSRVGRGGDERERVESAALVEQARERLAAPLEESGGEVLVAGELPVVTGDPGLLTAMFQNLISNAIKFRGEDPPRVRFEAQRDGRFWRFACTDSGIGVPDEHAERIFAIFQRLHTRDAYEGTGIGLAMCRKIVEHHGGRIWLDASAPDRGARFLFTLPGGEPEEDPELPPR
jgi:signal transduction histidine kinase